ncbi:MAG: hypothetical protein Q8876_02290 [Bacillota bacterium]|nr:hypothetical protein [Bacillota bacterium]
MIQSTADELKQNQWLLNSDNGMTAKLWFNGDTAHYTAISDKNISCSISGTSVVGDDHLIISDTRLKQQFYFKYKLTGNELKLTYANKELTLVKAEDATKPINGVNSK